MLGIYLWTACPDGLLVRFHQHALLTHFPEHVLISCSTSLFLTILQPNMELDKALGVAATPHPPHPMYCCLAGVTLQQERNLTALRLRKDPKSEDQKWIGNTGRGPMQVLQQLNNSVHRSWQEKSVLKLEREILFWLAGPSQGYRKQEGRCAKNPK